MKGCATECSFKQQRIPYSVLDIQFVNVYRIHVCCSFSTETERSDQRLAALFQAIFSGRSIVNFWGVFRMSCRTKAIAAAMLSLAALVPTSFASAEDLPVKAKAKPIPDLPFFSVIDDRISYSWMPHGTDPGSFTVNPNGTINGNVAKSVYTFTHFDVWAYGTNFVNLSLLKSDHNDPAGPCVNTGVLLSGASANCAGATEFYGLIRSTFGFNEIFNTKAFSIGPLRNVSFEVGVDGETENNYLAPAKRDFVAGLQFAFNLPYKGYVNVAPMAYKEFGHSAFDQCGLFGPGVPGATCLVDGNTDFKTTWDLEVNYYMDLGFLPENLQYFAISGRASVHGPKGNGNFADGTGTKIELNSEPIRLTFDASKAIWGPKYSQFLTTWVAYRYWQNEFGLDHNNNPGVCTLAGPGTPSTNSCTEKTVYAGVTLKF